MIKVHHVLFGAAALQFGAQIGLLAGIVDVVGTFDGKELGRLRRVSEYVAPLGFALLLINYVVISDKKKAVTSLGRGELALSAAVVVVSLTLIVPVQRQLVTFLADRSSAEHRRTALVAMSGWTAAMIGQSDPLGLGISRSAATDAQGKVAVLLLPSMLYASGGSERVATEAGRTIAQALFALRGSLRAPYEARMSQVCMKFEEGFSKYRDASQRAANHWFTGYIAERLYTKKRAELLGPESTVELGLTRTALLAHPEIQARARYQLFSLIADASISSAVTQVVSRQQMMNWLNVVLSRQVLDPCMSWATFERAYLAPLAWRLREAVQSLASGATAPEFGQSGRFSDAGRRLVELAVVPPLVTFWILLSSGLTVLTMINLLARSYFDLRGLRASAIVLALSGCVITLPFAATSRLAETPAFRELRGQAWQASIGQGVVWWSIEWVLRGVPLAYPPGRIVHQSFLRGG